MNRRIASRAALAFVFAAAGCATAADLGRAPAAPLPQADDAYFTAAATRLDEIGAPPAQAKNVILFIGDGMGVSTVTAARIFAGQAQGLDGESFELTMDTAPHTALSRTYSHDFQIADSAATATAMTTGAKTRSGVIGLSSAADRADCASAQGEGMTTLFELAEGAGLATGVVSTARITHATPASVYAHVPERNWESDAEVPEESRGQCPDIARQLIEWPAGDGLEIALGGGRAFFLPETAEDPEHAGRMGSRTDDRDLAAEWAAKSDAHAFVWSAEQLAAADIDGGARVLGLFSPSHMAYEADRAGDEGGEPSVAEMTAAAITRLSQNPDGFVLMVEGGRIDHGHHAGNAARALSDAVAFDDAIATALSMTSREDTLILATADHSHTFTIAGYAERGNPILGLSAIGGRPLRGEDDLPYTTLGYSNGPGALEAHPRPDLSDVDVEALDFRQQSTVPLGSETHGGEDVAIYAWGPGAEAVRGTLEQNVIFHILARAAGLAE
ncbi:MAG: alkaline phosphatase [Maricaulaceae bacterium]|jgi:alkaline phosphatase